MMNRYIFDTSSIGDRLSGYQCMPPTEEERAAEMQEVVERLANIIAPPS
jgi:hypothetical protein